MLTALVVAMRLAITVAIPPGPGATTMASATAAEADALWRGTGVAIEWTIGDRPGWKPDAEMLWILFTDRCEGGRVGETPIASITFVDGHPIHRIVVCREEAAAVVDLAAPDNRTLPPRLHDELTARVMGRAVAHEIGHYLFGPAHEPTGLMRASHSATDFCASDPASFALTPPLQVARSLPIR